MTRASIHPLALFAALAVFTLPVSAQRQVAKVTASNAAQGDYFGYSTAIDGDWAIIGAPRNDDRAFQGGAAYIFHRVNGVWAQSQQLLASDGGSPDEFGGAVAMSGDQAVVGAIVNAGVGVLRTGAAYVFERVGTTWIERGKLVASDAGSDAQFGDRVAISGDRIAVGAWNAGAGRAYVFERFGASWLEVARLIPNDLAPGDAFGSSVAIEGDLVVVGAPYGKLNPPAEVGFAYVFSRSAQGVWSQQQKLQASDGVHADFFGLPVSVSGNTIGVGAPGRQAFTGAAYFFQYSGTTWVQTQTLLASDGVQGTGFWVSAIQGDTAIFGANQDSDSGFYAGTDYIARRIGTSWVQTSKLLPNDAAPGDQAYYMSFSGTTVLIGAPGDNEACPQILGCASGSAYFFELAPTATQYGSCPIGAPCSNADSHGGCRNSTGQGAILQASGSGSTTSDDLIMEVRHLPPFAPGLIFMGGARDNTPFGSGRLVVGNGTTGIFRIEIHFADASGAFTHGPGLVALTQGIPAPLGHIQAGETRDFQCWYRDSQSPCGIGYNLSNGLEVSFVP